MKDKNLIGNLINTDAVSNIKGQELQKLRAALRLLRALEDDKKCIFCTIEYVDDVLQIDESNDISKLETEQNKNYSTGFSINSEEVKNSLRIFFDNWRSKEETESITFIFYTNTSIVKEKKVGILEKINEDLPTEPLLKLLTEKNFKTTLPFIVPVFKEYYLAQHKKHTNDIFYLEEYIEKMTYNDWESFFSLIEWGFNKQNEKELKAELLNLIQKLCIKFNVESIMSEFILSKIKDMISDRALEKDLLNKLVHVAEIELLFRKFTQEIKIEEKLDPMHSKWDEIQCNDVRNFKEKILSVCPDYRESEFNKNSDDFIDGKYEQNHCPEIRKVKSYNYRVYKVCKKIISDFLEEKENRKLSEAEVLKIIEQLTEESYKIIADKSKTYSMPYLDKDMVYKTILILFEECYLALEKKVDL